jgi:hypothetical protein
MTAVEICVECDIADCHHIRARRAAAAAHHKEPRVTEELNGGCLDEREAFEAWAGDQGFVLTRTAHGDEYQDLRTQGSWEGFQIGRASLSTSKQAGAEPVAWAIPRSRQFSWEPQDARYWTALVPTAAPGAAIAAREQEAPSDDEQLVATLIHCSREVSPHAMAGYDLASVLSRAAERIQSLSTPAAAIPAAPSEVNHPKQGDVLTFSAGGESFTEVVGGFNEGGRLSAPATYKRTLPLMSAMVREIYRLRAALTTVQQAEPSDVQMEQIADAIWGAQKKRLPMSAAIEFARAVLALKTAQTTALPGGDGESGNG